MKLDTLQHLKKRNLMLIVDEGYSPTYSRITKYNETLLS